VAVVQTMSNTTLGEMSVCPHFSNFEASCESEIIDPAKVPQSRNCAHGWVFIGKVASLFEDLTQKRASEFGAINQAIRRSGLWELKRKKKNDCFESSFGVLCLNSVLHFTMSLTTVSTTRVEPCFELRITRSWSTSDQGKNCCIEHGWG
jgi:hypothetical protein